MKISIQVVIRQVLRSNTGTREGKEERLGRERSPAVMVSVISLG